MRFDKRMHVYNNYKRRVNTMLGIMLILYGCIAYNHLESYKKEHFNHVFEHSELIVLAEQHPSFYDDFDKLLTLDPTLTIPQQREIFLRHIYKEHSEVAKKACAQWFTHCASWTPIPIKDISNITVYSYQQ